jgi:ATP-dependent DNA helicase DinG
MAQEIADCIETGEHLLVQAGTGTGKSLAYLVPALLHDGPVVVATATLALQSQIVDRDLPRLVDAVAPVLGRRPTYAILKGRRNYLCKNRLHGGLAEESEPVMFTPMPSSRLEREVTRLRAFAESTSSGDRDRVVPGVSDAAWAQVSVSAAECVGAAKCAFGAECFAESARSLAADADIVVTNHALLAIDALEGIPVLPESDVVIVDEAHDLVDRVTAVATAELTAGAVDRALARSRRLAGSAEIQSFAAAATTTSGALAEAPEGRLDVLPARLGEALQGLAAAARDVLGSLHRDGSDGERGSRQLAWAAVDAIRVTAERAVAQSSYDVAWIAGDAPRGPVLRIAPLSVQGLLRDSLFARPTVVLTSATLKIGGGFDVVARSVGLGGPSAPAWRGVDVGSPFDYPRQAMLYVARHLPPPTRDSSMSQEALEELAGLVAAAGGRTLGLFSSMRAAQSAADVLRERLDLPIRCQGEDSTAQLVREFAGSPEACLFGTLSLWQGVDVPGSSLQLVVIDRIPFPRPDDPLMTARARAVDRAGGNGFLSVSAAHAGLLLAQGSGRLIRATSDRGVVAVLDSRLATARYAGFLRASLPAFWYTTDPAQVRRSLAAIHAAAPPPLTVPNWRGRALQPASG